MTWQHNYTIFTCDAVGGGNTSLRLLCRPPQKKRVTRKTEDSKVVNTVQQHFNQHQDEVHRSG